MKKIIYICLTAALMTACKNNNEFTIKGKIDGAKGESIYLEKMGLNGVELIDSSMVRNNSKFSLSGKRNLEPELYRVRIAKEHIVAVIDSNECIEIEGHLEKFATNFKVNGSEKTENIRRLRMSNMDILTRAKDMTLDEQRVAINKHRDMAQKIIIADTRSLAAYYAIHQTINNQYYFSPYEADHLRLWSAVATAFDVFYPKNERSKELKRTTLEAIAYKRMNDKNEDRIMNGDEKKVGFIDIEYPDRVGKSRKLSDLLGKLVLIDFTAYAAEYAPSHTLFLRYMHEKYSEKGFEIYQVSIDENKLLWMEGSHTTPWICVRDNKAPNSIALATYNVTEIPTMFLMNMEGDILGRYTHENIEEAIKNIL